jgi:hemerythrin
VFVYDESRRFVSSLPAYYSENKVMSCGKIADEHKIYFELINFFKYQTEKLNEYSVADKMVNEIMDVGDKFVQMWEK